MLLEILAVSFSSDIVFSAAFWLEHLAVDVVMPDVALHHAPLATVRLLLIQREASSVEVSLVGGRHVPHLVWQLRRRRGTERAARVDGSRRRQMYRRELKSLH